jgi:membrane protease YdiL (CAAX protease family)
MEASRRLCFDISRNIGPGFYQIIKMWQNRSEECAFFRRSWHIWAMMESFKNYLKRTSRAPNTFLLALPWLLIYNVGVIREGFSSQNGIDIVTEALTRAGGARFFVVMNVLVLAALVWATLRARRGKGDFQWMDIVSISSEAAVYAVLVVMTVLWTLQDVPYVSVDSGTPELSWFQSLVISAGAGFYEELVFRLILFSLLMALFESMGGTSHRLHVFMGLLVSSVLFSLAHYVGPESFHMYTFLYRTAAGMLFGVLFLLRGFAAAVYTHVFYDLYVFLIL